MGMMKNQRKKLREYSKLDMIDISESTIINKSISMNQFYPIEALIFIRAFFVFP